MSGVQITAPGVQTFIPERLWPGDRSEAQTRYHEAEIEVGTPFQVAEDLLLLRLPLPFALNHINVYLVREDDGWVLIDCGVNTSKTRDIWDATIRQLGSLKRIIVTHHHPDHIGLAGWLADKFDIPVLMTEGEYEVAGRYSDPARDIVAERSPLWREHGLGAEQAVQLLDKMPRYTKLVTPLQEGRVQMIDTTKVMAIGERRFRPMVGSGHCPEHLSLLDEKGDILLVGDQVLPKITPNIAVWPGGDPNPLLAYFETLRQFLDINPDTLMLPSHQQPLYGTAARTRQIYAHHDDRLRALWDTCDHAMNACELIPAWFGRPLREEEMGFGLGEMIAHLNYLEVEGYLASRMTDSGIRVFEKS